MQYKTPRLSYKSLQTRVGLVIGALTAAFLYAIVDVNGPVSLIIGVALGGLAALKADKL